jgi:hypothetical protein
MSVALWYYVENGARIGPVEATEIERLIGLKAITRDTLVWEDGMQDWMAASQHFSFADAPPSVRLRTHNQNMTVAARAIAERKTVGDLS